MFKRILKWFFSIVLLAVIVLAIFLINLIWFRPWSLNLFYEKVFAEEIRSNDRRPEGPRAEANHSTPFRGRGSAQGNDGIHRQTSCRKYSRDIFQGTRRQDRQVDRTATRGSAEAR